MSSPLEFRPGAPPPARRAGPGAVHVRVRRAGPADLPHVLDLRLALLSEHELNPAYRRVRHDARARAGVLFEAQLRAPDQAIFLAERDGAVVGTLRCAEIAAFPLLEPATHGYVSSVYVVPPARRAGVLRLLVNAALDWCRARGLTDLRLHCGANNAVGNAAWDALGFQVAEHLRYRHLDD